MSTLCVGSFGFVILNDKTSHPNNKNNAELPMHSKLAESTRGCARIITVWNLSRGFTYMYLIVCGENYLSWTGKCHPVPEAWINFSLMKTYNVIRNIIFFTDVLVMY